MISGRTVKLKFITGWKSTIWWHDIKHTTTWASINLRSVNFLSKWFRSKPLIKLLGRKTWPTNDPHCKHIALGQCWFATRFSLLCTKVLINLWLLCTISNKSSVSWSIIATKFLYVFTYSFGKILMLYDSYFHFTKQLLVINLNESNSS